MSPYQTAFVIGILLACRQLAFSSSFNPYDMLDELLPRKTQPRVLNTDDLAPLKGTDPRSLLTLEGDFNGDGNEDWALSGTFNFPEKDHPYFLLVGTKIGGEFKVLHYRTTSTPAFLHKPGTTGEGDPGDQTFSVSFCIECEKGFDYYWDPKKSAFRIVEWKRTAVPSSTPTPPPEVPMKAVDLSLHIVGKLEDVKVYVAALKKLNKKLGTRVSWDATDKRKRRVWVTIFEKAGGNEKIYDRLLVDLKRKRVVRRSK